MPIKSVRAIGVEPTWIAPLDPKSSASANFATPAVITGSLSAVYTDSTRINAHNAHKAVINGPDSVKRAKLGFFL